MLIVPTAYYLHCLTDEVTKTADSFGLRSYGQCDCLQLLLVFRLHRKIIQNKQCLNKYSVNHLCKQETH